MVVLGSGQCYEPYLSQQPHNGSQFPLGNCGILTLALITAGAGEGVVECSGWLWASLKELTAVVIPSELVACVHRWDMYFTLCVLGSYGGELAVHCMYICVDKLKTQLFIQEVSSHPKSHFGYECAVWHITLVVVLASN